MTLIDRKYQLIRRITELQDEDKLAQLEAVLNPSTTAKELQSRFPEILNPIAETIDLATLKRGQSWQGFDREAFDQLREELAFGEDKTIEELIAEI